jgi:hypothetical protein
LDKDIGWFKQLVDKKLGCGNNTKFWMDEWVGDQSLASRFPRLYGISEQQGSRVMEMGGRVDGVWRWDLKWRRDFFVWEETLVRELEDMIGRITITESLDSWIWRPDTHDGFSIKSLYLSLEGMLLPRSNFTSLESVSFTYIWKHVVPSKVSALAWQLLLDRLPTKENLCRRGILQQDVSACGLCGGSVESSRHLFLHCNFSAAVWYDLCRWLGLVIVVPPDVTMSYAHMVNGGTNKRVKRGYSIVWLAYIWVTKWFFLKKYPKTNSYNMLMHTF